MAKRITRNMVPQVSNVTAMERVLGLQVTRRVDLEAAHADFAEAVETDTAQLLELHQATRARLLASTRAMTDKLKESQEK